MDYKKLIESRPLGSIERLTLIYKHGNEQQSNAAARCIEKRLNKMNNGLHT